MVRARNPVELGFAARQRGGQLLYSRDMYDKFPILRRSCRNPAPRVNPCNELRPDPTPVRSRQSGAPSTSVTVIGEVVKS